MPSFSKIAQRYFGRFARRLMPRFQDLRLSLAKAGKLVSLEMYLSISLFSSLIVALASFVAMFVLWTVLLQTQFFVGLAFSLLASAVGGVLTFVFFSIRPGFSAQARVDGIEASLPYTANYISVLSSSGIAIEKAIRSLLEFSLVPKIEPEVKMFMRNTDFLGMDTLIALRDVAEKTPSRSCADLFRGLAETIKSGGDASNYLRTYARWLMGQRIIKLKEKLENVSLLSEFFVTLAIAAPLFVMLLLPLMSILGEISFGPVSSGLILPFTLFVFIPFVSFIILGMTYLIMSGE